jgi:protein-S-isoprenylcysteine O-methyltransferase Ste14
MDGEFLMKSNRVYAYLFVIVQLIILFMIIFLKNDIGVQYRGFEVFGAVCETIGLVGILASASSLRTSLTIIPIPKKHGKLSTQGLYGFVRHPMYTSVLLFALGIAVGSGSGLKYLLFAALFFLFYFKSEFEEKHLHVKFPEYAEYASKTPRFIPTPKKRGS